MVNSKGRGGQTMPEVIAVEQNFELPLGLSMALARDPAAMAAFSAMTPQERQAVIDGTHRIRSAAEMRQYVAGIGGTML